MLESKHFPPGKRAPEKPSSENTKQTKKKVNEGNSFIIACNPCSSHGRYRTYPINSITSARRAVCRACVECICFEIELHVTWEDKTSTWEPISYCISCIDKVLDYLKESDFAISTYYIDTLRNPKIKHSAYLDDEEIDDENFSAEQNEQGLERRSPSDRQQQGSCFKLLAIAKYD